MQKSDIAVVNIFTHIIIKLFNFKCKFFGNIVNSAHRPRIAAEKSPASQRRAFHRAETLHGFKSVTAASGIIFAGRRKKGRNKFPVKFYQKKYYKFHLNFLIFFSISLTPYFLKYPQYSSDLIPTMPALATMTISMPTGSMISEFR